MFDSQILRRQSATLDGLADFPKEIASSRTFVFVREIEPLLKKNLIKGGDLPPIEVADAVYIFSMSYIFDY